MPGRDVAIEALGFFCADVFSGEPAEIHVVFEIGKFDFPRDGIGSGAFDKISIAFAVALRHAIKSRDHFFRKTLAAQIVESRGRVFDNIMKHSDDARSFALAAEHDAQRMQDVRLA